MASIVNLLVDAPKGMWPAIIGAFNNAFVNYALSIIILTLVIKLILSPFDFYNKKVTRKNTQIQAVLAPEMAAIRKKYPNDKEMQNRKTQELYKKNNFNVMGSCLIMLAYMVVTLVVFISLFNGLNSMASYKITYQYEQLQTTYEATYQETTGDEAAKMLAANEAVVVKYKDIKDSFLWIDNVWLADSPTTNSIPTFDAYKNIAKKTLVEVDGQPTYVEFNKLTDEQLESAKSEYEKIMTPLRDVSGKVNGYYILAILAAGTSVLMQLLAQGKLKRKNKNQVQGVQQPTNKIMLILMPLLMGYFTLIYNSVFALYIVTGQVFGTIMAPIIDAILRAIDKKIMEKQQQKALLRKGRIVK